MSDVLAILPTRGLIFSETIRSLKRNEIEDIIIVENKPIPDAQNEGVRQALDRYVNNILFVEDDMSFPEGVITAMMKLDAPIVAANYPMDNGYETICRNNGEIWWCGLGLTLIKRGVFTNMKDPWFDTSYSWKIESENPLTLTRSENPSKYGGHDINFCMKARELGFSIHELPGVEIKHLRCNMLEKAKGNDGVWEIAALSPISKRQNYGKDNR